MAAANFDEVSQLVAEDEDSKADAEPLAVDRPIEADEGQKAEEKFELE
jgi:hypothetical protein